MSQFLLRVGRRADERHEDGGEDLRRRPHPERREPEPVPRVHERREAPDAERSRPEIEALQRERAERVPIYALESKSEFIVGKVKSYGKEL